MASSRPTEPAPPTQPQNKSKGAVALAELQEKDKQMAREVWLQVESNYVIVSKELFNELFKQYPDYKKYFKEVMKDGNHIDEEAWSNPAFERHMVQVLMPAFGRILRDLDQPEEVVKHMKRLGQFHKKQVKIKKHHVENLKRIFAATLKDHFGPVLDAAHETALFKVLNAALSIFTDEL